MWILVVWQGCGLILAEASVVSGDLCAVLADDGELVPREGVIVDFSFCGIQEDTCPLVLAQCVALDEHFGTLELCEVNGIGFFETCPFGIWNVLQILDHIGLDEDLCSTTVHLNAVAAGTCDGILFHHELIAGLCSDVVEDQCPEEMLFEEVAF